MSRQRTSYVECCIAARAAFERAASWTGPPLPGSTKPRRLGAEHYRVLCAVVSLTALYSKLSDYVFTVQIAALAGIHVKNAQQRLRELATAGIIEYEGGGARPYGGRGHPSRVGLPEAGAVSASLWPGERGADSAKKGSRSPSERAAVGGSPTEKVHEKKPEESARARARGHALDEKCHCGEPLRTDGDKIWCPSCSECQA